MRVFARNLARIEDHDIDDVELDSYLDEGYDRVVMHTTWEWMKASATEDISMVPGQTEYPTTAAVEQVTTVINKEQRFQLRSLSKNQLDRYAGSTITTTQPVNYYWVDGLLTIFPSPSSTDTLEVHYVTVAPFGSEGTDVPPFNDLFHRTLVDWALHRIWEVEEDFEKSQEYRLRFEESVQRMTDWYTNLNQDTPNIYGQSPSLYHPTNMPFLDDAAYG